MEGSVVLHCNAGEKSMLFAMEGVEGVEKTQIYALTAELEQKGFSPEPDFRRGLVAVRTLPEFQRRLAFTLFIAMDDPMSRDWRSLFEGCVLESGRAVKGAVHGAGIYSRKKAVERAKQEKWAALWSLHDAGILPGALTPGGKWEEVSLP